jgi:hypothetical protein
MCGNTSYQTGAPLDGIQEAPENNEGQDIPSKANTMKNPIDFMVPLKIM